MKRNRYYGGKHLTAESFITEQTYHRTGRNSLAQLIFGSIPVMGMKVSRFCDDTLSVSPGLAVDGSGRLLRLNAETLVPLQTVRGYHFQPKCTLHIQYDRRQETEYIDETFVFTHTDVNDAVALADVTVNDGKIASIDNKPRVLDSALSRLLVSSPEGDNTLRQELSRLKRLSEDQYRDMYGRLCHNAIHYGETAIRAGSQRVLYSDAIPFPPGTNPFYVHFEVVGDYDDLLLGDSTLFPESCLGKNTVYVVKKAVRMVRCERIFQLAIETTSPYPQQDIPCRWVTIGDERQE